MEPKYRFHGHAIVSANDCIADSTGAMPESLRNPADWQRFQAELDRAVLVVLGRRSHDASPNVRRRRRLILSASVHSLEERADGWWWNPSGIDLFTVLAAAAPKGGVIAIPGGRQVFDFFLALGFDAFDLTRAARVRLPGGVPVFSACREGETADAILRVSGLEARGCEVLDPDDAIEVTLWRRLPPALTPPQGAAMDHRLGRHMEPSDVLRSVPFFGEVLDAGQIDALAPKTHERMFPPGGVLMEENDFGSSMFVLTEGTVRVSVNDGHGGDRQVAELGQGDIVGEMSLMTGARRTATVTALTEVAGLEITKVALESVLSHAPELFDRFCAMLERRKDELARIQADAGAWHILGMSAGEIAAEMRRFFGSVFGHRRPG